MIPFYSLEDLRNWLRFSVQAEAPCSLYWGDYCAIEAWPFMLIPLREMTSRSVYHALTYRLGIRPARRAA